MKVIFLNWFERVALYVLVRSPRIGMLAVKEMDGPLLFIANDPIYVSLIIGRPFVTA